MSISIEQTAPLVGSSFVVHTVQGPVELKLASATELPRRGLPERFRTPLSLIFLGPASAQLAQGLFTFDHPVLGRQQWTLVPVIADATSVQGVDGSDLHYEVFFS
jgi:hypothetical protein